MKSALLAIAGLSVYSAFAAAQGTAAAIALSPPAEIRATGAKHPTVAVDPRSGAVYLGWAQDTPAPSSADGKPGKPVVSAMVARSDDGGAHFADARTVNPPDDDVYSYHVSRVTVRVGPEGQVYALYGRTGHGAVLPGLRGRPAAEIGVVRSTDGGRTFAAPVGVATPALEGLVTSPSMNNLFVAPDGTLYASWLDPRGTMDDAAHPERTPAHRYTTSQLRVAKSTDGGKTFQPSTAAEQTTCVCCGTIVAQGRTGPLYASTRAAWGELKGSVDAVRDIFVARSADHGATWDKSVKVHDDQFKVSACPDVTPGLEVDGRGRLHAAWYTGTERGPGIYYAVSSDQGKTFTTPIALLKDDWVPYADVRLALDHDGQPWIAWVDRRGDVDQVNLVHIAADGSVVRATPWPGSAPDLALRTDGALVVTWGGVPKAGEEDAGDLYTRTARLTADTGAVSSSAVPAVTAPLVAVQ